MPIAKQLYLRAPRAGVAVYATGQCYTAAAGTELLETVVLESRNTNPDRKGDMAYYYPEQYVRRSPDNGRTWAPNGPVIYEDLYHLEGERGWGGFHYRDPDNGRIVRFFHRYEISLASDHPETFSDEGAYGRTQRLYYRVSGDQGRTWGPARQVVASGAEFDEAHWGPGLYFGQNGGIFGIGDALKLKDGTLLMPMVVNLRDGRRYQSGFIRGRWLAHKADLTWEFSDYIAMPLSQSTQGCCEPTPVMFENEYIFVSLRCCGDRDGKTFPSLKYWVVSTDGGRTFSAPQPLTYEDGRPVWSPSSMARIIRSAANDKAYWIGNILSAPTYSAYPRYPLCIAELIPEKGWILKASVAVIDTKPPDFPEDQKRRYTNFGCYEDRETGKIVLTLPEQPKTDWNDFTADCYKYSIPVA